MRSFFKIFFASFLALVVFVVVFFFFLAGYIGGIASKPKVETGSNAVLVLDLSETFGEKPVVDALAGGELAVEPLSSLGLLGHSRGGGVAVLYTSGDSRVGALVTWAPISTVERWTDAAQEAWRLAGSVTRACRKRVGKPSAARE